LSPAGPPTRLPFCEKAKASQAPGIRTHEEGETRQTRKQGGKETRRQGDKQRSNSSISLSPLLLVSPSPHGLAEPARGGCGGRGRGLVSVGCARAPGRQLRG